MEVFTGAILSPGPYVWHPWDARENSSNGLLKYELQAQSYYKIKQMFLTPFKDWEACWYIFFFKSLQLWKLPHSCQACI